MTAGWLRLRRRLACSARDERGFSLAEVVIASSLMVIAGASLGSVLVTNYRATANVTFQSRGIDELRVAVARIEREFRSAECVYEPVVTTSGGSATGSRARFKTRVGGGSAEVTYRVEGGTLYRTELGVDETVASDLVDAASSFTLTEETRRRLDIVLAVEPGGHDRRTIETSVTGRNAWRDC
ncbi:MAG: hypothetical protein HYU28_09165 [Actinobacteria bacterium]|nr:hypothetical protein [Actinomycetota bacterium]